jgi:hypothetical protein
VQRLRDQERLVELVRATLQQPVRERSNAGDLLLESEAVPEVAVGFSDEGVSVFVYSKTWRGPSELVADHRRLSRHSWEMLPEQTDEAFALMAALIDESRWQRAGAYRVCRECGKNTPPEFLEGADLCMGCAPGLLGIVY